MLSLFYRTGVLDMYNIVFYETASGYSDIRTFLDSLRKKAGYVKDARIQFSQLARYIQLLQDNGINLPAGVIKHIDEDIWELRPGINRVFFFCHKGDTYVLLHHFRKKTQKTPIREIIQAKAERDDYISRNGGKK